MAKRVDKQHSNEHYDALKKASGWYLQAWRHYRNLSLEELAEEAKTSRGNVHDLETAAKKKDGRPPTRYNRDWIDRMSKALDVEGGHLLDVNPFNSNTDFAKLKADFDQLDDRAKQDAQRLIAALRNGK